jgi:signal transduction histidine kinase/DNA-binding response OmpR family regulator
MTIKQSTINWLAVIAFLLMALLLAGSVYFAEKAIQEHNQAVARQAEFKQLGIDLADASDYLTDEARKFAVTGNIKHLQNYWHEIEVTKTRDNVLTRLKELKAPSEEFELLNLAKHNSDALVATETRSMRLVLEAQTVPKSLMHPAVAAWTLSAEDIKRSREDKMKVAREIMFDAQYDADKRIIMEPIAQFQQKMNARAFNEVHKAQRKTQTATVILIVMVFLILSSMGIVLWIFQIQLSIPIAKYIRGLQRRDPSNLDFALTPAGTQELHLLAQAFNQQFQANQQQLKENRQVIEDIVEVSAGLANGNLHVMPQAEYPGEFVQIKNALEKTLTSLRQVIEDIVHVSQGLAEGDLQVMPETQYRGELVQIKNALISTTSKLAKTTAKNHEQNWLKTGQTQFNDQLRGEKNVIQLAENAINFLTPYVEAQVGTFYLFQENAQQSGSLKMIASHAYIWRKTIANEFNVGEGLVGQAALERKMIVITEPPRDYLYIQSGLGGEVPRNILVIPFLYEDTLKGIIELASFNVFTKVQIEFLQQVMSTIAIAIHSAQSRQQMQELLQQTQMQSEELQRQTEELHEQQETLQQTNEELQSQSEELQVQQETLRHTNEALEERSCDLETQQEEIREKNRILEQTQKTIKAKAKELELANQYKSEFLANMSHELRTPLNSLLILAKILADNKSDNLDEKQMEYAQTIYNAGNDLLRLINEILDLSKIEAGKMEIQFEDIVLLELVENLEQKFHPIAQDKRIAFQIILAEDLPTILHTDTLRLQQILNNLLSNAFKFTEEGEVRLNIWVSTNDPLSIPPVEDSPMSSPSQREGARGRALIAFSVTDTGVGIPTEKQSLIFEAFQQADGTTSRRYGGTGLGLSISRQLARLLGGELTLVSQKAKGSHFTLYLPENDSTSSSTKSSEVQTGERVKFSQPEKISNIHEEFSEKSEEVQTTDVIISSVQHSISQSTSLRSSPYKEGDGGRAQSIQGIKPTELKKLLSVFAPLEADEPFDSESEEQAEVAEDKEPFEEIVDDSEQLQSEDKSLLILEDNRKLARLLIDFAREREFKCVFAEDGNIGLYKAEKYQPNAIMLDVSLPPLYGQKLMKRLKENPKTRHIPVYLICAKEDECETRRMGAFGHLLKPASTNELNEAFDDIEEIIAKILKTVLVVVDDEVCEQRILETVGGEQIQTTTIKKIALAFQYLQKISFDCIIIDIEVDNGSGIKLIEQLHQEGQLSQTPIILHTQREVTTSEQQILQQCEETLTVKAVKSQEHLLDKVTLFLHQKLANLPEEKRHKLKIAQDSSNLFKGKKVLVVDDDMRNAFALVTILEDHDMEVVCGKHGKKALEKLDEHPDIALVLMDIMMPEMNGYEAMREIRKQPRFHQLPVIALTAKAMKGDKAKCLEAGASDYLSKPVDTDKLLSLMQVWLYQ